MLSFFLDRLRGWPAFALVVVSVIYGATVTQVLPYWNRMEQAIGGTELQGRNWYSGAEAATALEAIHSKARSDAFLFYALDTPNAVLYASAMAAMIAFGLRQIAVPRPAAAILVALPLIAGAADIVENACLSLALLNAPTFSLTLGAVAGVLTATKFLAGTPAQILALTGVVLGTTMLVWRRYSQGNFRHR
jgi:hypothetical protein